MLRAHRKRWQLQRSLIPVSILKKYWPEKKIKKFKIRVKTIRKGADIQSKELSDSHARMQDRNFGDVFFVTFYYFFIVKTPFSGIIK